jgi:hypothetical protein
VAADAVCSLTDLRVLLLSAKRSLWC